MTTIDRDLIENALGEAGLDEDALYEDYSGRGMFGTTTFGIVGSIRGYAGFLLAVAEVSDRDTAEMLADHMRTDSLGLDTIFYFPGLTLTG